MRAAWVGKRQSSRAAVLIRAEIRTGDDAMIGPCAIVDISKSGARARLEGSIEIPPIFALVIASRAETRVCKLRWHRENEIGIEFVAQEQITAYQSVATLEHRVKAIESTLAGHASATAGPQMSNSADDLEARVNDNLELRVADIEIRLTQMLALVQEQISHAAHLTLAARLESVETQSREIHETLKSMLPMLTSRAS